LNRHRRLREIVAQPDTVLFVGSGVSAWSGLPTWPQLIAELAEYLCSLNLSPKLVERELKRGDLLQAASYGVDQLSPSERAEFLRDACRLDSARPSSLHERIATLGPRCFITTNYDKLLEKALFTKYGDVHFRLVNNTNPLEAAGIIQTHSKDFVFKAHGDIDAVESTVLTREDYRLLQEHRRHSFDAFKTLLASRPVVFVGFGLRDPDFLLVKDTLATIYQGAAQDHYALVPDADEDEASYWRRNYGVHLISYETDPRADAPPSEHAELLSVLDDLCADNVGVQPEPVAPPEPVETLALLRHLKRLQQLELPTGEELIPLMATPVLRSTSAHKWDPSLHAFERTDAASGLARTPKSVILTGSPGAGKTVIVRSALVQLAERGIESLLGESADESAVLVPGYLDLKDYTGDLWEMAIESFPVDFPLDEYVDNGRVLFFVDGMNEVPAAALEDNSFRVDIRSFLSRIGNCKAVLVTRFGGENEDLDLPELELDSIPDEYLDAHLEEIAHGGEEVTPEIRSLLQRPVFFRFFREHDFPSTARTPHLVYEEVLRHIGADLSRSFAVELDLTTLFATLAFARLDAGEQLMPADDALAALATAAGSQVDATALLNWLIERGLLAAHPANRVAFFHHSITEYMAGYELARRYRDEREVLRHCLRLHHWDHAVLLALGFLDGERQSRFFAELFAADPIAGLRGLAFVEAEKQQWTEEALKKLQDAELSFEAEMRLATPLSRVAFTAEHLASLTELSRRGNTLGGTALAAALKLRGKEAGALGIDSLFDRPDDYNFQTAVAEVLADLVNPNDLEGFLARLAAHPLSEEQLVTLEEGKEVNKLTGLISAAATLLGAVGLEEASSLVGPLDEAPALTRHALIDLAREEGSTLALSISVRALPRHEAIVALHFQLAFREPSEETLNSLAPEDIGPLLVPALDSTTSDWATSCLRHLAKQRPDWRSWLSKQADADSDSPTIKLALLRYSALRDEECFDTLAELARESTDWNIAGIEGLSHCDELRWGEHRTLFFELLELRNRTLCYALLRSIEHLIGDREPFNGYGLPDAKGWVEWLAELAADKTAETYFVCDRLGRFIADAASSDDRKVLLELMTEGADPVRRALTHNVLGRVEGLELDELSDDAVAWLVEDLRHTPLEPWGRSTLASIATEALMEETIIPLLEGSEGLLRQNIVTLAENVGRRHGRRYVAAGGESVL